MLRSKKAAQAPLPKSLRIRTGDSVLVIAGEDKSTTPRKVLGVLRREGKVIVEGVNVMKDRVKKQGSGRQAGINEGNFVEKPCPIDRSKVALVDPRSGKPTRVKVTRGNDGKRVRVAGKSGEAI